MESAFHGLLFRAKSCFSHTNPSNFRRPALLLITDMLFQLLLTKCFKSELFSCLPKADHMINKFPLSIHLDQGSKDRQQAVLVYSSSLILVNGRKNGNFVSIRKSVKQCE